jgi:hypothetical protein
VERQPLILKLGEVGETDQLHYLSPGLECIHNKEGHTSSTRNTDLWNTVTKILTQHYEWGADGRLPNTQTNVKQHPVNYQELIQNT